MTKQCKICGDFKDLNDFYKHATSKLGRESTCIQCQKDLDASDPKRREKGRLKTLRYRARNKDKCRERDAQHLAKRRKKYPEKFRAYEKLKYAIKTGVLTRPSLCSMCGDECTPHGHHEDYTKPLEVDWLCPACHVVLHRDFSNRVVAMRNYNNLNFRPDIDAAIAGEREACVAVLEKMRGTEEPRRDGPHITRWRALNDAIYELTNR